MKGRKRVGIVKVHNKARNITYVYESESYWDKDLKQPRSHRRLIGRMDPLTGEIVPTGRKSAENASAVVHSDTHYRELYEQALITLEQKEALIAELRQSLAAAEKDKRKYQTALRKASGILMDAVSSEVACHA